MAKYLDENGLLYFWQKIKTVFATQTALNTLSGRVDDIVSEGGEPNVIDTVKVNGTALTPDANKAVNVTIAQGSANGTIAVNGSDVSVKGLGSAAYKAETAFDAAGAADAVLGSASDSATANTVYGAKAAAAAAQDGVDGLETLVGATAVAAQISNAIKALDSSASAAANKALASITITDGKITAHTDISVPTNNNQLTNGAGYQTASDVSGAINDALADITSISFEVVQSLPSTGAAGTIYLVSNSGSGTNSYDEYIYVNNSWEKIGTTDVDLSSYWNTSNLVAITNAEIDTIVAA